MRPVRPCASCTVATPRRSSAAIAPLSARWMLRTTVPIMSACSRDPAGLEKLLQRLAAEGGHHLRIRDPLGACELLQAEEARAVVLHGAPVEPAHHVPFLFAETLHRFLRIFHEQRTQFRLGKPVQEAVEPQPPGAALEVEDVLHSNSATAMAVVMGR